MPPMCQAALCSALYINCLSDSSVKPREVKCLLKLPTSKQQTKDSDLSVTSEPMFFPIMPWNPLKCEYSPAPSTY